MSTSLYNPKGNIVANTITALTSFSGSLANATADTLPRDVLVKDLVNVGCFLSNDVSGNMESNTNLYMASSNLHLNPSGGSIYIDRPLSGAYAPAPVPYVQTTTSDAVPTQILDITTAINTGYALDCLFSLLDSTNNKIGTYSCNFQVLQGASLAAPPSVSGPYNVYTNLDPLDSAVDVQISSSNGHALINVVGIAATNLKWGLKYLLVNSN